MGREMKDSGIEWIGEIPADWEVRKVKHYYKIQTGFTPDTKKEEYYDDTNGYDWVNISDIQDGKGITETKKKISQLYVDKFSPVIIPAGSLLYSFKLSVGQTAFAGKPLYSNEAIASFLPYDNVDLHFLRYSSFMIMENAEINIYNARILNRERINNAFIVFPPIDEQHRIASFLDTECFRIDAVITKTRASIEEYKRLKQSVITQAVTKGIRPGRKMRDSGIEWIGEVPIHWIKAKLGHICSFHNGDRSSNYPTATDFVDEGIPFIGADSLNERYVNVVIAKYISRDKYETMGGLKIQRGDILYTLRGSTIGKNSFANFDDGAVASSLMGIRVRRSDLITPIYLYYWLNSEQEFLQRDIAINGSTAPNLSAEDVKLYKLFLPPIEEQKQITQYLDEKVRSIDLAIQKKTQLISEIEKYKKSIIFEYTTGKKEVLDADYSS